MNFGPGTAPIDERLARLIIESATELAIISLHPDGTVRSWNSGAENLTGWCRNEMGGRNGRIIFTPEDRAAGLAEAEMSAALRDGRAGSERWYLRRDGSRFFASGTMALLRDEASDAPVGFVKILRDRTRRHESETLSLAMFESSVDCVKILDLDGRLKSMNSSALRVMEIDDFRPFAGREWASLWPETAQADLRRALDEARVGGIGRFYGFCPTAKGTPKWWDVQVSPVMGPERRPQDLLVVSRDVTERGRVEAALREKEARLIEERARLTTLVENLPVGVCFVDPAGNPLLSNPAYRRFVPDLAMPSLMPAVEERWIAWDEQGRPLPRGRYPGARALRGETVPGTEFLHRPGDGQEIWTRVSCVPVMNTEGQIAAAILVLVDIDEQKRAQQALQRLNATLEQRVAERTADRDRMWRLSTDIMFVARLDTTITAVNPAWTTLLGWHEDELIGRSFGDFVHPDDADVTFKEGRWASEGLTTRRFESRLRHKDGGYRWLSWTAVPAEELLHAVGRDVTAEKQAAEALARAEAQLRQSQKMEAMGQLTGGVAHDFNNLLAGILGSLELLEQRLTDDRQRKLVASAARSAQRGAQLTQQLLAFARKQHLQLQSVDLNAAVSGMIDMLQRTIGATITVHTALAPDLWPALADITQTEIALLNLAINARDAMPLGGALLIETRNVGAGERDRPLDLPAGLDAVLLAVSDTGEGMPLDVQARVFEPFFTTKEPGKGTGLGLSQVYGVAQQSGGTVRIRSTPGKGTIVEIYLPCAAAQGSAAACAEGGRAVERP